MWICPKCGNEVEASHKFCGECGTAASQGGDAPGIVRVDAPPAAPAPPPLTAKQRMVAGAKVGGLYGAISGGLYGFLSWGIMAIFASEPMEQKLPWLPIRLLEGAVIIGAAFAVIGALLYLVFPPKPKPAPPVPPLPPFPPTQS
jgi:hypothetical protein